MFIPFLYELRARKVQVGTQEAVALAGALAKGLHESSLDGFYLVARALLIHDEKHLDAFDEAFGKFFQGIEPKALELQQNLLDWLRDAKERLPDLTPEKKALLEQLDRAELEKLFEQRLKEQKERHDGGNRWVGTAGSSPFGNNGRVSRPGIRVGGGAGRRSAVTVAGQRNYREYRDDLVLDVLQLGLALRMRRALSPVGEPHAPGREVAFAVGPPVQDAGVHLLQERFVEPGAEVSGDSAHSAVLICCPSGSGLHATGGLRTRGRPTRGDGGLTRLSR